MNEHSLGASWKHCSHLQISSDEKSSCLECGLVMEIYSNPYIRSITHYKQFYKKGIKIHPFLLHGLEFKEQAIRFLTRKNQGKVLPKKKEKHEKPVTLYDEYVFFLRQNQDKVLPKKKKPRQRELCRVYGEHKRMILEYISNLSTNSVSDKHDI